MEYIFHVFHNSDRALLMTLGNAQKLEQVRDDDDDGFHERYPFEQTEFV